MPLDWLNTPLDADIGELIAQRKRGKAIETLRRQLQGRLAPPVAVRLQLADLLMQAGRIEEAVTVLLALADEFASDGFVAKAVAILKRVDRVHPGRADIAERLERLVHQQKRVSELPSRPRSAFPEFGIEEIGEGQELIVPTEELEPEAGSHPSDETPAGYVTAASLWGVSGPRPDWSTEQTETEAEAVAGAGEAASVSRAPASNAQPPQPGVAETRHSFPAVPPGSPGAEEPKPRRDEPPAPPNRARIDGRTAAIVAVVVLLAAVVTTALVVLTGGSEPERAAAPVETSAPVETETPMATAKPKPKTSDLDAQVKTLDELMRLSRKGRAAAVEGDIKAATANRAQLLKDIKALDGQANDEQLKAALASFSVAIAESLRQNRECGSKCSDADLAKVGKLKQAALAKINPILKAHGTRTYTRAEI